MNPISRRQFVVQAALAAPLITRASAAGDKINLAFVGPGGMGTNHIKTMCKRSDVIFSYVCDADSKRAATAAKLIQELTGQTPKIVSDMRRVFEDKAVQAVLMATPDHWHAPGAILAASAGKHVYVEKPCSHNLREGRLMIEAAAKNKVAMQVGTQSRSTGHIMQIIEKLRSGIIGDVLVAKARDRRLSPAESKPGIATVTNFGTFGIVWATPIPLPEQNLVLGLGAATRAPTWDESSASFKPVWQAEITLSFDHRVIDGADGARFITIINNMLSDIRRLVM